MVKAAIDKMSQTAGVTPSDTRRHIPVIPTPQVRDIAMALSGMPDAAIEGMKHNATPQEENTMRVPTLDIDREMLDKYGRKVSPNGRLERRIVAALCEHMTARGFNLDTVYDGVETTHVHTVKAAMELIFNLDEASLRFKHPLYKAHGVLLVLGNGEDIVSDWNYTTGDPDGFNAAMEAFDVPEVR
jgi:hypothetical protein